MTDRCYNIAANVVILSINTLTDIDPQQTSTITNSDHSLGPLHILHTKTFNKQSSKKYQTVIRYQYDL